MSKHQKHTKLPLRNNDNFAPNEIALLGTKCGVISNLVTEISKNITFRLAYLDASHTTKEQKVTTDIFTFNSVGKETVLRNKQLNKFNQRIQFSNYDLVFVNGNHYQAAKQILILDDEKEASVLKRIEQLTDVKIIIKTTKEVTFSPFLKEKYPNIENIPMFLISEIKAITNKIEELIIEKQAKVQGLVLAGGKSVRMGKDKGKLHFYGKNQRDYVLELLKKNNLKSYLSVRAEQVVLVKNKIEDTFFGLGPFGAICSAFRQNPNAAWLVIATDVPFVTDAIIKLLLQKRNPSKIATAIKGKSKLFPEPLITIWEPKSYPILLQYLSQGYSCPRKVLINSDVEIVEVDDYYIQNINTPEEYKKAIKKINE